MRAVRVYVVGALAPGKGGMTSERIFAIRDFWLQYFKATGGDLTKERYGSTLLEFEGK